MNEKKVYNTWSEEEIHIYLSEHTIGHLGTIDEGGFPHVVPMWYVLLQGHIHFSTRIPRKKIGNLRKNPLISFTVDSGEKFDEYRGALIQGKANIVEDPEVIGRYNIAFAHRHLGSEDHPYVNLLNKRKRVVSVIPTEVSTWDYQKAAN